MNRSPILQSMSLLSLGVETTIPISHRALLRSDAGMYEKVL